MSGMESTAQFLERIGADGAKWAHEFKLTAEKLGHFGMDEGWLIGWFCNAISAGKGAAHRRASQAAPAPSDGLREAVDAAWNDAIEAGWAYIETCLDEPETDADAALISDMEEGFRALRRAAPTEGEA